MQMDEKCQTVVLRSIEPPDYKSVRESGLLSALLSISTPTLQCKLFNMKSNVHLMMTINHRMPLEAVFL